MYVSGNNQSGQGLAPLGGIPPGAPIFVFRGGAATWFGTQLLGVLITVLALGICYPVAVVLVERWRADNTLLLGHALRFTGTGWGIFGLWIKWFLLCMATLGIYSFRVYPRLTAWKVEHTVPAQRPAEANRPGNQLSVSGFCTC